MDDISVFKLKSLFLHNWKVLNPLLARRSHKKGEHDFTVQVVVYSVDVYLMFRSLSFSTQPSKTLNVRRYMRCFTSIYINNMIRKKKKNTCTSLHNVH